VASGLLNCENEVRMVERRSGVDLTQCKAGWGVVFDGKLLSLHPIREDAVAAARIESLRVLADPKSSERRACMPRLQSRREGVRRLEQVEADDAVAAP
jgi:hypothetical protein